MKKTIFLSLIIPLLYIGCGESENQSVKNDVNNDINMTQLKTQEDLLKELGLEIENEKFSIDINKTSNFLKKMEIEMHGKADEIQNRIEKADINFTRDMGISFDEEKVEIDLNKTRKMFQEINILMKEVLLENNSSKP